MSRRLLLRIAILALVYTLVARLGLAMDAVGGFATLVWPPTGIALAALLLGGSQLWPGVLIGAFVVNVWMGAPLAAAAGMATGNTLEALLGAYALRRAHFHLSLDRVRDVAALLTLAAVGSTLVSATVGVLSMRVAGMIRPGALAETWRAWWIGDVIGDLVVAPLLLTLARPTMAVPLRQTKLPETLALTVPPVLIAVLVFALPLPEAFAPLRQPFLLFPALVWPALRFGPRGVAAMTFLISTVAIAGTAAGLGPFVKPRLNQSLTELQVFVGAMAVGLLVLGALVAERRRAQAAEHEGHALLRAVAEGTTDAVFVKDRGGKYLMINEAGARALGRPMLEVLGHDDHAFFPAANADALVALDRAVMEAGGTRTLEEAVVIAEQPRVFLSTKAPYRDRHGQVIGLVGISRDITERKRAEKALVDAVGARDEFLSIASHELRTPLSVLALELGSLERRVQRGLLGDPAAADGVGAKLKSTLRQTDRLNHLIGSLLEVSRISAGRLIIERETLDLVEVAREVVERFTEHAARAGCALTLDAPAKVTGQWDRLRLEQVLTNLMSNALKYGARKPVAVAVEGDAAAGRLIVRDQGIGIAAADLPRIFDRFERAVSPRHYGGLGLGLYISRQIAEAHGGVIRVQSDLGEGSTFTVELPRTPAVTAG